MKPANFPFKEEVKCFVYIQFVKFDKYSLNSVKLAHRKISTRRVCHLCSPVRYLYTSEVLTERASPQSFSNPTEYIHREALKK